MNILTRILKFKNKRINTNAEFWEWFRKNEKSFYDAIQKDNIVKGFLNRLEPKIKELRTDFYYLAGIYKENIAELIISAEGDIKNFVFVEELIAAAPKLSNWKFTALKQEHNIENTCIEMDGYSFSQENIFFSPDLNPLQPDNVSLEFYYLDYNEDDHGIISRGIFIFLDVLLGELASAEKIDYIEISRGKSSTGESIPVTKLKDYIEWREKEFIGKYEGTRHDTKDDIYATFNAELKNGMKSTAVMNMNLLNWDAQASHPWIVKIDIQFNGKNGLPDDKIYNYLESIEEYLLEHLLDSKGYLYIGRTTGNNLRTIYFACHEFRIPSKVVDETLKKHSNLKADFIIYKDKYWNAFNAFKQHDDATDYSL